MVKRRSFCKEGQRWKMLANNSLFACFHIGMPTQVERWYNLQAICFQYGNLKLIKIAWYCREGIVCYLLGGDGCFEHLKEYQNLLQHFQMLIHTTQLGILRIPRGLWRESFSKTLSQIIRDGYRNPWYMKRLFSQIRTSLNQDLWFTNCALIVRGNCYKGCGPPASDCQFCLLYILNFCISLHLKKGVCYTF